MINWHGDIRKIPKGVFTSNLEGKKSLVFLQCLNAYYSYILTSSFYSLTHKALSGSPNLRMGIFFVINTKTIVSV
jgi:hypothetical protein